MDVDLFELSNNHIWRTQFAFTDFGLPAPAYMNIETDEKGFTERGWIEYGFENYYTLLNCGFRMRPTAGTASGVHPVPLGFGRVGVARPGERPFVQPLVQRIERFMSLFRHEIEEGGALAVRRVDEHPADPEIHRAEPSGDAGYVIDRGFWLHWCGQKETDLVPVRFDELQSAWVGICRRTGMSYSPLPHENHGKRGVEVNWTDGLIDAVYRFAAYDVWRFEWEVPILRD